MTVSAGGTPDPQGEYIGSGTYGGRPYYSLSTNYDLWWDTVAPQWIISAVLGAQGAGYWYRDEPDVDGIYSPAGTALGNVTVTKVP